MTFEPRPEWHRGTRNVMTGGQNILGRESKYEYPLHYLSTRLYRWIHRAQFNAKRMDYEFLNLFWNRPTDFFLISDFPSVTNYYCTEHGSVLETVKFKKISSKSQEWRSYHMLRYIKLKMENGVVIIGDRKISSHRILHVPTHFQLLRGFGTCSLCLARL